MTYLSAGAAAFRYTDRRGDTQEGVTFAPVIISFMLPGLERRGVYFVQIMNSFFHDCFLS